MYSFATGNSSRWTRLKEILVNDGFAHKVLIQVAGNKVYLTVDEKQPQSVLNDGKVDRFETSTKTYLYLGGMPKEQLITAKDRFHIMGKSSLIGDGAFIVF